MKAIWKCFIAGIVLVAIGAGIIITTLAVNGWSLKEINHNMQTFTAEHDNTAIEIDVGANALRTEFYDGEKIEITYPESKVYETHITEHDGKLKFESKTKWYVFFSTFAKAPETVIKLPVGKVFDVEIDMSAGTVKLAEGVYNTVKIDVSAGTLEANGVTCTDFDCDVSAGTVNFSNVVCNKFDADVSAGRLSVTALSCPDINADVSAGTLSLGIDGAKSDYTIFASVSAGSCNVSNQAGSTGKTLKADCSAGTIEVSFTN